MANSFIMHGFEPEPNLSFDCEMVLDGEILDKPYANENARRIVMLEWVLKNIRDDMSEVSGGDIDKLSRGGKMLTVSGMLINQALETILVELGQSPMLATRLSNDSGVEFDHTNFDKGKIQMVIEGDIVTVKMRLGSLVHMFEAQDVNLLPEWMVDY